MDLCTVTNKKYLKNVFNLVNSYKINSYNKNIFIYCFDMSDEEIETISHTYEQYRFIKVPKVVEYAYDSTTFFYKCFAINDCIKKSSFFAYSDATNVFNRLVDIERYLIDDSLLLPYNHNKLTNLYWTTQRCFEKMNCVEAAIMPQYWAGFQVYKSTNDNVKFISEMYKYMLDADIALPNISIKKPDGDNAPCVEHRQDQSVLSNLIHKHYRHQKYDVERQNLFGDWQTFISYEPNYKHDLKNASLSSRESKFGYFRFL